MSSQSKEINLSIEESNALRAKLGLKPLRLDNKDKHGSSSSSSSNSSSSSSSSSSKRFRDSESKDEGGASPSAAAGVSTARDEVASKAEKQQTEEDAAAAAAAAKQRKEEAERQKRRVAHALLISGETIASAAAADSDILDPLAWVSRMRKEKKEKHALAAQGKVDRVRYDDESDSESDESSPAAAAAAAGGEDAASSAGLCGARVAHEAGDLPLGEAVTLTLQDAQILAPDGSLNEDADVLESLQLREKEKQQEKERRLKQKSVYDAAEELVSGKKKDILSHYDEWRQEEEAAKGLTRPPGEAKGFLLEDLLHAAAGNGSHPAAAAAAAAVKTEEETEVLGAPAFRRAKKPKKEKQRKTGRDFWLELAGEGQDAAAPDHEDPAGTAAADSSSSSNSKSHHAARDSKEPKEKNIQKERVAEALAAASKDRDTRPRQNTSSGSSSSSSSSSRSKSKSSSSSSKKKEEEMRQLDEVLTEGFGVYEQPKGIGEEEMDPTEIEKQRLLAQIIRQKRKAKAEETKGLLPKTAMLVELAQQAKADEREEEGLQLTGTTEFCRSVLTPMEKAREARTAFLNPKPTKGIKISNSKKHEKTSSTRSTSQLREEAEEGEVIDPDPDPDTKDEEEDSEPEFMGEEPIGNSVSGALAYLQSKDFFSLDKIRRRRGHHLEQPLHNGENEREVNIDYRDAFGNVMTAKDAFRRISWHFHGKFPSLRKQEKKLKKLELEKRLQENLMESLPTLKALQRVQEGEGSAHLVLTGGSLGS